MIPRLKKIVNTDLMIKGGKGNNYIYLLSAVHHSVSHFVKQKKARKEKL